MAVVGPHQDIVLVRVAIDGAATSQGEVAAKAASHNDRVCPAWKAHKVHELNNFCDKLFPRENLNQNFTKAATISVKAPS